MGWDPQPFQSCSLVLFLEQLPAVDRTFYILPCSSAPAWAQTRWYSTATWLPAWPKGLLLFPSPHTPGTHLEPPVVCSATPTLHDELHIHQMQVQNSNNGHGASKAATSDLKHSSANICQAWKKVTFSKQWTKTQPGRRDILQSPSLASAGWSLSQDFQAAQAAAVLQQHMEGALFSQGLYGRKAGVLWDECWACLFPKL